MFRPFKWIKTLLPKTLLGRSLIIIIAPVILIQSITTYVFIDRHWTKMTQLLASGIAGDTAAVLHFAQQESSLKTDLKDLQHFSQKHFGLQIAFLPLERQIVPQGKSEVTWRERFLYTALQERVNLPFRVEVGEEFTSIKVGTLRGNIEIQTLTKRLFTKTTPILLWWALGTPFLFLLIAVLFMRNQVRPLIRLSEAVGEFGKGRDVEDLRVSGALEIRKVTRAFNEMRQRIQRQITQRTEMLAGISHDLRTPLTRMELQLAMLGKGKEIKELREDVKEMEKMVNEYLAFARGEDGEKAQKTNVTRLIRDLNASFPGKIITYKSSPPMISLFVRQNAFGRCVTNLVDNALRYGEKAWVNANLTDDCFILTVEDDGPGIEEVNYEDVFRPFFRIEDSRNSETGGNGLGLAITKDIIHSHGGTISLGRSSHGGLKVIVTLPV